MSAFLAAIPLVGKVIDRVFPDPATQAEAKLKLFELQQSGELAELEAETRLALGQIEVNKEQARHGSLWVAGVRPAVMWVCAAAMAWSYILHPVMEWGSFLFGYSLEGAPDINSTDLMPLLLGMLGLGGMRSFDKRYGVDTQRIK